MSIHNTLAGFATFISPINNLSVGVVTATQLYGNGSSITGVGLGTTSSINTSGIVTASRFSGDGSGLTDVGGYLAGLIYSPAVGATGVGISSNISITFNKHIVAGVGTITLRTGSDTGTIVESFNIASSNLISISGATLTVNPTSNLSGLTTYYLVVPANTVKDTFGTGGNLGITSYSFTTKQASYPLFGWGTNGNGQLGQNNTTYYSSPVQIPGTTWSSISGGNGYSLATKTDGTLWSWGYNTLGNLGQNNTTRYSSPVQIPGTTWSFISSGSRRAANLVTKTDGTLWAWGRNTEGGLGQNNTIRYSSPVQIPGTTWSSVSVSRHSLALKTDGTLWSFGYNGSGQLGLNDTANRSSPVQIPGTTWSSISVAYKSSLATKTDGTLWSWGYNSNGELGQNNRTYYSSPAQIPGTTWKSINGGNGYSLATKTDGTLWAWGNNANGGPLGQNDTISRSSPVQIPGTTWNLISAGGSHTLATKTDGTLWGWGSNYYGSLGENTRTYRSSPVQILGTAWNSISTGYSHSLATKAE